MTNYFAILYPIQYGDKYSVNTPSYADKYSSISPTFDNKYKQGSTQYLRKYPPTVAEKIIENQHLDNLPPSVSLSASAGEYVLSTNYFEVLYPIQYGDKYSGQDNPYLRKYPPNVAERVETR